MLCKHKNLYGQYTELIPPCVFQQSNKTTRVINISNQTKGRNSEVLFNMDFWIATVVNFEIQIIVNFEILIIVNF